MNKKFKIKKSDKVIVISGKEKGNVGIVRQVLVEKNRVIVEGLNKVIDFNKRERTGISEKEASIHISNVAHLDPVDQKATKVAIRINGDTKQIISKRSGKVIR